MTPMKALILLAIVQITYAGVYWIPSWCFEKCSIINMHFSGTKAFASGHNLPEELQKRDGSAWSDTSATRRFCLSLLDTAASPEGAEKHSAHLSASMADLRRQVHSLARRCRAMLARDELVWAPDPSPPSPRFPPCRLLQLHTLCIFVHTSIGTGVSIIN